MPAVRTQIPTPASTPDRLERAFFYLALTTVLVSAIAALALMALARPVDDDFNLGRPLCRHGFSYVFGYYYLQYSGRWAEVLLETFFLSRVDLLHHYWMLLLGIHAAQWSALLVFWRLLWPGAGRGRLAAMATLAYGIFWCTAPYPGETYYWFTGGVAYSLSLSLAILTLGAMIEGCRQPQQSRKRYLLLGAAFALAPVIPAMHEIIGACGVVVCLVALISLGPRTPSSATPSASTENATPLGARTPSSATTPSPAIPATSSLNPPSATPLGARTPSSATTPSPAKPASSFIPHSAFRIPHSSQPNPAAPPNAFRPWLTFSVLVLAGFLVSALAPGNSQRASTFQNGHSVLITIKSFLKLAALYVLPWIANPTLWGAALLLLTTPAPGARPPEWLRRGAIPWRWAIPAATLVLAAICLLIPSWAMGGANGRILTLTQQILLLGLCATAVAWGARLDWLRHWPARGRLRLAALALLALSPWLTGNLNRALREGRSRAIPWNQALISQFAQARAAKAAGKLDVEFAPVGVTRPTFFYSDGITPDPANWRNWGFAEYFGLRSVRVRQ